MKRMGKRFKEYRMFLFCFILFLLFIGLGVYSLFQDESMRALGLAIFALIALFLLLGRYKMVLYDDMMMIYEWKVAAMLPTMIEYKDIQSIEKKSKHHLVIHHRKDSHIYVFNSDAFISYYESLHQKS